VARPWHDSPKKKKSVPLEQTEALQSTRQVSTILFEAESFWKNFCVVDMSINANIAGIILTSESVLWIEQLIYISI